MYRARGKSRAHEDQNHIIFLPRLKKVTDLYKTKFDISTSLSLIPEVHQSLKFKWSVSVMSPVNCWYIYQYILRKAICSEELVEKRCQ